MRLLLLFCFFKQKTAYEMRISDWSSDVCSSDLGDPADLQIMYGIAGERRLVEYEVPWLPGYGLPGYGRASPVRVGNAAAGQLQLDEIGRASCRERVCQYGVDLGGRRIINTKQNKHRHGKRLYIMNDTTKQ